MVKSIFTVIVVDGIFAVFFASIPLLSMAQEREVVIWRKDVKVGFGDRLILDGLDSTSIGAKFSASSAPPAPASPS